MRVYIDGVLAGQAAYSAAGMINFPGPWRIGNRLPSTDGYNGLVDDFAIFGAVLSDAEIARLYAGSGTADVIKRGSGTLTLLTANSYGGETSVEQGTLVAAHNNALGLDAAGGGRGTTVHDGAVLELDSTLAGADLVVSEDMSALGRGAGSGAIVNVVGDNTLTGTLSPQLAVGPSGPATSVRLQKPTAIYSQPGHPVSYMINGIINNQASGWANNGLGYNAAVFETAVDLNPGGEPVELTFTIQSGGFGIHELGKFRLSVTTDNRSLFADGLDNGGAVTANWIQLTPTSAVASQSPLAINPDNSVLLLGTPAEWEYYTVKAITNLANITGVRLEALEDPSLPGDGPGRNNNFVVQDFGVSIGPAPVESVLVIGADGGSLEISGTIDLNARNLELTGPRDILVSGDIVGGDRNLTSYDEAVLADSPIVYLPFDEGAGATAFDASGHGADGAITGAVFTQDRGGQSGLPGDFALNFDDGLGGASVVTLQNVATAFALVDNNNEVTIELWQFGALQPRAETIIRGNGPAGLELNARPALGQQQRLLGYRRVLRRRLAPHQRAGEPGAVQEPVEPLDLREGRPAEVHLRQREPVPDGHQHGPAGRDHAVLPGRRRRRGLLLRHPRQLRRLRPGPLASPDPSPPVSPLHSRRAPGRRCGGQDRHGDSHLQRCQYVPGRNHDCRRHPDRRVDHQYGQRHRSAGAGRRGHDRLAGATLGLLGGITLSQESLTLDGLGDRAGRGRRGQHRRRQPA